MKLSFSTNAYGRFSLFDALESIARVGYQGVEIMADRPHAYPPDLDGPVRGAIRGHLRELGLEVTNINAFMLQAIEDFWHPSWIEPDPLYRARRVSHTVASLELAAALGAPGISTEPGGPLPQGMERAHAMDLFVDGLGTALKTAERLGVDLLIEPEPGLLLERADQFLELMGRISSPRLGLNFDVGHFFCVGEDPAEVAMRLAPYIRHVHLEDIPADRTHKHLIPGRGALPLKSVLLALAQGGYEGWLTVEIYPYQKAPEAAARLALGEVEGILASLSEQGPWSGPF